MSRQQVMDRKIRILECIRQGQIGGGESHLLSLVSNLDRSKFDPVVLSFTDGPMVDRLRELNIDTQVIYTEKPFDISKWKIVKEYLRQQSIDLVHAHGTRASSNVLWAARSLKIPVIYTIHGWSFHQDQSLLVRTVRVLGEKFLTRRSALNISVSKSNQESGKKVIRDFESIVVNNGIDRKKFNPDSQFPDIRAELNLPKDKTLVLFIARFTSHKQPLALIEAFKEAVKLHPSMHLLMVGDGDQKEEAVRIIEAQGLKNDITLVGFRQDVPAVLAAADIFVLPSLWEGLPIGLLEAMSMGKAIIASKVDGTIEIVHHEENGLLIDTKELVPGLTRALIGLSQSAPLREQYGRKAIETVRDRFNAENMTRQIEKLYLELLN
ncbi:MAG: glycosyltransferase family 1 protein [Chitinophagaceae bacterium]|jgi:glycosyltransferase involved in cell wall biosynthesis|nr:MAG: glycosyltransferase family 1 protein [Chitinophagaceae bacterium]